MQNSKLKNESQVMLFNLIQNTLKKNIVLVDEVAELLGIGTTAAYRRINGTTPIDLDELIKLCKHFQIPIESLTNIVDTTFIKCRYSPLHFDNFKDNITFIQVMYDSIESVRATSGSELILSAVDIPLFNIFSNKELTLFKFFSWAKNVYDYDGNYEEFAKEMERFEILKGKYEKILASYQLIPSTEIWTDSTVDTILRLVSYHYEMKHFNDEKLPLLLCNQLFDVLDTIQKWAENGTKGPKEVPFKFYVSDIDIANTFILFKRPEKSSCMIRLYTINAISTSDECFCKETESWLQKSTQRATLISNASARVRFKFFDAQRKKIQTLIDKIESD